MLHRRVARPRVRAAPIVRFVQLWDDGAGAAATRGGEKKKKLDPPLHADNRPHPTPCLSADLHCVKKKKKKKKKLFWTLRYDSGYQRKSSIALFKFLFFFKKLHTWIFISNNEMWSRIPKNGIVHQVTHFKCTSINITSAAVTLNLIGCLIIIV